MPTCKTHFAWTSMMLAGFVAGSSVAYAQDIVRQPLPAPSMPQATQPQISAELSETSPESAAVTSAPLEAPPPEMAGAAGLEQHLNHVQDILTDQENVDPNAVKQAEELDWSQAPVDVVDGDFPAQHDAESKIGWVAPGKKDDKPKVRKPKVDLKQMTRVKLNENGSTVLDLTKGRVIHRF